MPQAKKIGNITVEFIDQRIAPLDFLADLPKRISQLRVDGATTDEAAQAERFIVACYLKSLLEEDQE